ncbi:MAG: nicotinamide mononucleotide transporter family protein [Mycoplasmoidaceae bacterium]
MKQKNKFIDFVAKQNYIKELSIAEHIILWLNVVLSLSFFIVQLAAFHNYDKWPTWLTFAATITSIFSVMAGAKRRILCPFLGIVSSIMLCAIAWYSSLYGTMIMHGFNIIMQTITLVIWYKGSKNKVSIEPKHLQWWIVVIYIVGFVGLSILFAWIQKFDWFYSFWSGGKQTQANPWYLRLFDSMVLMFTIAAAFPMFKKYDFVWWVYIIADVAIASTWITHGLVDAQPADQFNDWSMLVSGLSMTATCVLGIINWRKSLNTKK